MILVKNTVFIVLLCSFFKVNAHGDLSARIMKKTMEIAKNPESSILYFERGVLLQQHDDYKESIKDYLKSERLGLDNKELYFRKAETYYLVNKFNKALKAAKRCLNYDAVDVKTHKLKAKILFKKKKYKEAITSYNYVLKHTVDLKPEDYITYNSFILAIDEKDYEGAIATLDLGLKKTGNTTLTFQLKKLEYLKKMKASKKAIKLYNTLIENTQRKEFFYYEKAKYLLDIGERVKANIAMQQSKLAIKNLKLKYQNTIAIKKLQTNINILEKKL